MNLNELITKVVPTVRQLFTANYSTMMVTLPLSNFIADMLINFNNMYRNATQNSLHMIWTLKIFSNILEINVNKLSYDI